MCKSLVASAAEETVTGLHGSQIGRRSFPQLHLPTQFHLYGPSTNHTDIIDRFVHDSELSKLSPRAFRRTKFGRSWNLKIISLKSEIDTEMGQAPTVLGTGVLR